MTNVSMTIQEHIYSRTANETNHFLYMGLTSLDEFDRQTAGVGGELLFSELCTIDDYYARRQIYIYHENII